jgi:serine/threonine protein kinase
LNLVLKDNPLKKNVRTDGQLSSLKVSINGGTDLLCFPVSKTLYMRVSLPPSQHDCYQAPELFKKNAKFSRRADVFAAGVVFLELLTLQRPNCLCDDLYPGILDVNLPEVLLKCFSSSLDPDPQKRLQFKDLLILLRSQEGAAIGEMRLGSPTTIQDFDEVSADIRLMMPSSQYEYNSNIMSQLSSESFESSYQSSSVMMPEKKIKIKRDKCG